MTTGSTLLDVIASILAWLQQAAQELYILGAIVGLVCALSSGFALWRALDSGDRYNGPPLLGLSLGVVAGSVITIFSIIVGWFSLFYTGT